MTVVALGGLAGAGARTMGPILAEKMGADYVDRLILTNVARHVGATVEALHQREERPPTRGERFTRFLQRVLERSAVTGAGGDPYFGPGVAAFLTEEYEDLPEPTVTRGHELEDEKYIEGVQHAISDMATDENIVMVGRGCYYILKDTSNVLRVGIEAEIEDRAATIAEREHLSIDEAIRTVSARDEARQYFFNRFFDIENPDAPEFFHFVINTSHIPQDYAIKMILDAVEALRAGELK
ncbi:MAG: cytidylate kinase-like family protein [Chloroflexi bacterium]|nr:cytidylate kinase-like family protein [Chloroflexota bacterium]